MGHVTSIRLPAHMPFTRMRLTRVSTLENVFKSIRFWFAFSPFSCKREVSMHKKECVYWQKRLCVNVV